MQDGRSETKYLFTQLFFQSMLRSIKTPVLGISLLALWNWTCFLLCLLWNHRPSLADNVSLDPKNKPLGRYGWSRNTIKRPAPPVYSNTSTVNLIRGINSQRQGSGKCKKRIYSLNYPLTPHPAWDSHENTLSTSCREEKFPAPSHVLAYPPSASGCREMGTILAGGRFTLQGKDSSTKWENK